MVPSLADVKDYLGETSWSDDEIAAALLAEQTAQARRCRIPVDLTDPLVPVLNYSADLIEALYRRVSHNLAVRGLPLGVQSSVSELNATQMRVGGTDAEVKRLEAPYRRLVVG